MAEEANKARVIIEMQQDELAVRIGEAMSGLQRPEEKTPEQVLDATNKELRAAFLDAAKAAIDYFAECAAKGSAIH